MVRHGCDGGMFRQRSRHLLERAWLYRDLLKDFLRLVRGQLPVRDLYRHAVSLEDRGQQQRPVDGVPAPCEEGREGPFHYPGVRLKGHAVADKRKSRIRRGKGRRKSVNIGQRFGKPVQVGLQASQAVLHDLNIVLVGLLFFFWGKVSKGCRHFALGARSRIRCAFCREPLLGEVEQSSSDGYEQHQQDRG